MTASVHAVSLYGSVNAGVRARLQGFLDRLDVEYQLHSYFDGNAASLRQFARRPQRAPVAERELRRLAGLRPERLVLSREASPLSKGGIEQRLLRNATLGVYDLDDALHHDVRGPLFESLFAKSQKAQRSVEAAQAVIAGNEYLAEWASARNTNVRVIPTCVDPDIYTQKSDYRLADPPRLVWLGTPSGERYLKLIEPALVRLNRETGATVTVVGDERRRLGRLEDLVTRVPWDMSFVSKELRTYDIGLMPLADTPYERGKCAYKLLEYGAAKLPVIASPVSVNQQLTAGAGFPQPETVTQWYDAMHAMLASSAQSRNAKASTLRDIVKRDYSFDRWLPAWGGSLDL